MIDYGHKKAGDCLYSSYNWLWKTTNEMNNYTSRNKFLLFSWIIGLNSLPLHHDLLSTLSRYIHNLLFVLSKNTIQMLSASSKQ